MTLNAPLKDVLFSNDLPLGVALGTPRDAAVQPAWFEESCVEAWTYASGDLEVSGMKVSHGWECDRELGLIKQARVVIQLPAAKRPALLTAITDLFTAQLGAPKRKVQHDARIFSVPGALASTLTVSERTDANNKVPFVYVALELARGVRLRALDAPPEDQGEGAVPAGLVALLAATPPFAVALGSKAAPAQALRFADATGEFPKTADLRPRVSRGKVAALDLVFPSFEKEAAQVATFDALSAHLTNVHGKPKRAKKSRGPETRDEAAFTVGSATLTVFMFEFLDDGMDEAERQVGIEVTPAKA